MRQGRLEHEDIEFVRSESAGVPNIPKPVREAMLLKVLKGRPGPLLEGRMSASSGADMTREGSPLVKLRNSA
jgi:hypothetical protein